MSDSTAEHRQADNSVSNMNSILEAVETSMQQEITQIRAKFSRKRQPMIDAMIAQGWAVPYGANGPMP